MVQTKKNIGFVSQIIGPVLDIVFPSGSLPPIYSALKIETEDGIGNVVEVQQLLGDNKVRAVSMRSTDGLKRGVEAVDLGAPISVPVGTPTLGRIFNVIGEPVDEQGDEVACKHRADGAARVDQACYLLHPVAQMPCIDDGYRGPEEEDVAEQAAPAIDAQSNEFETEDPHGAVVAVRRGQQGGERNEWQCEHEPVALPERQ